MRIRWLAIVAICLAVICFGGTSSAQDTQGSPEIDMAHQVLARFDLWPGTQLVLGSALEIPAEADDMAKLSGYMDQITPPIIVGEDGTEKLVFFSWHETGGVLARWEVSLKEQEPVHVYAKIIDVGLGRFDPIYEGFVPSPDIVLLNETLNTAPAPDPGILVPGDPGSIQVDSHWVEIHAVAADTWTTNISVAGFEANEAVTVTLSVGTHPVFDASGSLLTIQTDTNGAGSVRFKPAQNSYTGRVRIEAHSPSDNAVLEITDPTSDDDTNPADDERGGLTIERFTTKSASAAGHSVEFRVHYTDQNLEGYSSTIPQEVLNEVVTAYQTQVDGWGFNRHVGTAYDADGVHHLYVSDGQWMFHQDNGTNAYPGAEREINYQANLPQALQAMGLFFGGIDHVIAHEHFHGIQFAYGGGHVKWSESAWYVEGAARFTESVMDTEDTFNANSLFYYNANQFVANTDRELTDFSYDYVLFWGYLYTYDGGLSTIEQVFEEFNSVGDDPQSDGPAAMSRVLSRVAGSHDAFDDLLADHGAAVGGKDLTWNGKDWGTWLDDVTPAGSGNIAPGTSIDPGERDVHKWAADYWRYTIDPAVAEIVISVDGENNLWPGGNLYDPAYSVLLLKNNNVVASQRTREVDHTFQITNNQYDAILLVVHNLNDKWGPITLGSGNYQFHIEASSASLQILDPSQQAPDVVGSATNPFKTYVDLEIKTNSGVYVKGVKAESFEVTVGSKTGTVLTSRELHDKYVLEVQPPTQTAEGAYDLKVQVFGNSDTEQDAIQYSALGQANVDVMQVLDRSGSMGGTPIENARNSAKLFVDLMSTDDMIGVASFASSSSVNYPLTSIASTQVKLDAQNAINGIYAGGSTSIGAGLEDGRDELLGSGQANHPWAIVLLSDGQENVLPYVATVLPSILQTKIKVFTIGLGGVDEALMQDIAYQTGGIYYYTPSDTELASIYNSMSGQVSGKQTLFSIPGAVQTGETNQETIQVDGSVTEAIFSVAWNNSSSNLDLTLKSPTGRTIDPQVAQTDANIDFVSGSTYEYYRIIDPEAGRWIAYVYGAAAARESREISAAAAAVNGEAFALSAQGVTPLTFHVAVDKGNYQLGDGIRLQASISSASSSIPLARVVARVKRPDATIDNIILYDDGNHGDETASDGVYGNFYVRTDNYGSYQFDLSASGFVAATGQFYRLYSLSAFVGNATDTDGDGMPDNWEEAVHLNPGVYDAVNDPDVDNLTNVREYQNGADPFVADTDADELGDGDEVDIHNTNPTNADTDLGGESDGSEVANGREPLDPEDDLVASGRVYLPAVAKNQATHAPSWSAGTGFSGQAVYGLAVAPDNCGLAYAATDSGVYKSTNGGASWARTGLAALLAAHQLDVPAPPFDGAAPGTTTATLVPAVATDPFSGQVIYAAAWGSGVYKSTNGGTTWAAVNNGLGNLYLYSIAVDPTNAQVLYAGGSSGGVYRSVDGAGTWSPANVGLDGLEIRALAIDPLASHVLYAGTLAQGVYKSTNGGISWAPTARVGAGAVWALAIDPAAPQTLYAGVAGSGVYKSTNGGGSWTPVNTGLAHLDLRGLVVDGTTPQTLYAGTNGGGVYRTTSGGAAWQALNDGLGNWTVKALYSRPGCGIILAGTANGAWRYNP